MTETERAGLSILDHFTGTECYYSAGPLFHKHKLTEGAQHVRENGASWLIDAILSHQCKASVRREPFQSWTLAVDLETHKATLTATDGNEKRLARQVIEYTDFPLAFIKFYLADNVLMLTSEY